MTVIAELAATALLLATSQLRQVAPGLDVADDPPAEESPPPEDPKAKEPKLVLERLLQEAHTPLQKVVKAKIKERVDKGKDAPEALYEPLQVLEEPDGTGWGRGTCPEKRCPVKGYVVRAKSKTIVSYKGPKDLHEPGSGQAKATWPKIEFVDPQTGVTTDYTGEYPPPPGSTGPNLAVYIEREIRRMSAEVDPVPVTTVWKRDDKDPFGAAVYGEEPRIEEIEEELTYTFPEGHEAEAQAFAARLRAFDASASQVLSGFAYFGPHIDYTVGSTARTCLWGHCVTAWDIRAGFALDWAFGLRVPGVATLSGPLSAPANTDVSFTASYAPANFAEPDYTRIGAAGEGGREFLFRTNIFAGAYVKIAGADVCPICQYVDWTEDKSTDLQPPFTSGAPFPLPTLASFPIKSFNYGIVNFSLGLDVTPTVTSAGYVSAVANGAPVAIGAAGTTLTYRACMANGVRQLQPGLSDFRYPFGSFSLAVGMSLDFDVAGKGNWHEVIPFVTLDLAKLGGVGSSLGQYVECDAFFNCGPRGTSSVSSQPVTLVDAGPPVTQLSSISGTPGNAGWYRSVVTGAVTGDDGPCQSGVASTSLLVDKALQPGTTFTLGEGIHTVEFFSVDAVGHREETRTLTYSVDVTPPAITVARSAQPNAAGWYRDPVTLTFSATDGTSLVQAGSVTPPVTVTADGAGQRITGQALDVAGNVGSLEVTPHINMDRTPPGIRGGPTVPANAHGWWREDVTVAFEAWDPLSGIAEHPLGALVTLEAPNQSVLGTTRDVAGNPASLLVGGINLDKTRPEITGAPLTSPNGFGWYRSDVTVRFAAFDALSGLFSLTPDVVVSAEAADQSVTGEAVDLASNAATFTVEGIDLDKTAPALAISVPEAKAYESVGTFAVTWSAPDALSGIQSEAATLDGVPVQNGEVVELIYLGGGDHVVAVRVDDRADNVATASVTFLVDVDIDGLVAAVQRTCDLGWIGKKGTCNSLMTKALAARQSIALSLWTDAQGQLGAFLHELEAQRDKAIDARAYRLLRVDALYVLKRYVLSPGA